MTHALGSQLNPKLSVRRAIFIVLFAMLKL